MGGRSRQSKSRGIRKAAPRKLPSPKPLHWARLVTLFILPLAAAPGWTQNRANLVRDLALPKISLNFQLPFYTGDLRVPLAADPAAEMQGLAEELKKNESAELYLRMAKLATEAGRLEESAMYYRLALDGYEKQVVANPRDAQAHLGLAEVLLSLGDDREAAAHIEEALVLDETQWKAHELAANLHAKHAVLAYDYGLPELTVSHLAAASEAAEEAMRLAPDRPEPYVVQFIVKWIPAVIGLDQDPLSGLDRLAQFEEMAQILQKAAQLAPTHPKLRQFAITCKLTPYFAAQMVRGLGTRIGAELNDHQKRVLASCREELIALANEVPSLRWDSLLYAGLAAFMMGDDKAMLSDLRASADADLSRTEALEAMVGFLVHGEKWTQALAVADELAKRAPSGRAYCWIGRIYAEQGQWKKAEEAFRRGLNYEDARGMANLGLGVVLLKSGAPAADALAPLQEAFKELGEEPEVLLALGAALVLAGQTAQGKEYAAQALQLLPPSPATERLAKEFGVTVTRP